MNNTKISIKSGSINKDIDYKIHLKDNSNYCYDENTGSDKVYLKVKIVGPYIG